MNLILATDSYKMTHWAQYPAGTTGVYSYLEARKGATYPETVFFGLQPLLEQLAQGITAEDIDTAERLIDFHIGPGIFNRKGWEHILDSGGHLPVRIKAVPEGTVVPVGNVLMTVENTDPEAYWLTNALESMLLHVWYPITVATLSYNVKKMMKEKLAETSDNPDAVNFMLHDFGYRGAATHDAAAIGGAAHLVNFMGTDTLPPMELAMQHYDADPAILAFSVPATEHSVMTSLGAAGEMEIVSSLLDTYPTGILSIVADSYDVYQFTQAIATTFKDRVMARDGKVVVRPDSITAEHPTPALLCVKLLDILWEGYGGTTNSKGYRVLDPHVGLLWGDGIDPVGIEAILDVIADAGYAADNMVFGMGGGLLQKVNRDTQRFAFKCSAQQRNGEWIPVSKRPLDASKSSKAGRLALAKVGGQLSTVTEGTADVLETVFEDGKVLRHQTFAEIRANSNKA